MFYLSFILLIVIVLILNKLYTHSNHYKNQFLDVKKIHDSVTKDCTYQIVNLGSNHPKFAFDYSCIPGLCGANWAVGPQTFEYDFAILKKFRCHLADNAIVILPICLKSFFLFRQSNRTFHARYYKLLPQEYIINYSFLERLKFVDFPLIFNPRLISKIIIDTKKDERLSINYNPMQSDTKLNEDANYWITNWDKQFGVDSVSLDIKEKNKNDIYKNILVLRSIIDYCISEGLRPVLCLIPVTHNMLDRFTSNYLEEHLFRYIRDSNVHNIPFLNYLFDETLMDKKMYFNSFFFNKKGRTIFTKRFIDDLVDINLL